MREKFLAAYQKAKQSKTNCFITIDSDFESKIQSYSDEELASLKLIAHKDVFTTSDLQTTAGSKLLEGYHGFDGDLVRSMKDAGYLTLGKVSMDEFAMGSFNINSAYGPVKNPQDLLRVPGGSSGGSAAVVGEGIVDIATASDTGGSIRIPASFCGVIGFKPTTGLISRYGMISYASSLDTPGFITSNLEVLSDAMEIQKKELEHRSHHDMALASGQPINVSVKKIGYSRKLLDKASPAIKDAYFAFIDQKKDDYEFVCIDDLIFGDIDVFDTAVSAYYIIACAEAASNLSRYDGIRYGQRGEYTSLEQMYYENRKFFGPEVKRRIALGNFVLSSEYYDAYYDKAIKIRRLIAERFEVIRQQCDVLYLPCSPKVAPTFEEVKLMTPTDSYLFDVFNIPVNLVGLPSITLPITKIDSLKVGFQFIGMTALADWSLIDFAKGLL